MAVLLVEQYFDFARDLAQLPETFADAIVCATHFPLNYFHTIKLKSNGAVFHMRTKALMGFDKEYELYVQGGLSYLWNRAKEVIGFVEKAVEIHKKNIKLTFVEDAKNAN